MSENLFEKPQSEESAAAAAYEAYEEALEAEEGTPDTLPCPPPSGC